jgi:hypothetical protein
MSADFPLRFRFKGQRNYVQGPDIHDSLCDALAAQGFSRIEKVDVVFHRMSRANMIARFVDVAAEPEEQDYVVFRANLNGEPRKLFVRESTEEINERSDYDEDRLVAAMQIDAAAQRAVLDAMLRGYSVCESIVSMNKALLGKVLPEARGKWLFTRLQAPSSIRGRDLSRLEVRFLGHSNYRITRSELVGDGEKLGSLFFSLQPAA